VPSYGAVRGILVRLDVEEVEARLSAWAQEVGQAHSHEKWPGIAVDGKTVRASQDEDNPAALHLLSAFSHQMQVVLGQRAVPAETNEIPVARELLEQLTLEGMLVTLDAMHAQHETAELIVEKGGPI
jgi:Zn-dependent M28 family amino/carboxypeptidase